MTKTIHSDMLLEQEAIKTRLETIEIIEEKLKKERKLLIEFSNKLKIKINEIEINLKQLNGIQNKLYYYIAVVGFKVTQAVDHASVEFGLNPSTIWRNYYPKVKEIIKKTENV